MTRLNSLRKSGHCYQAVEEDGLRVFRGGEKSRMMEICGCR